MRNVCAARKGFTLIELLVVIAIISLLVSIMLPSLQKAKELARQVVCQSNLKNLQMTFNFYLNDHDGVYPFYSDPSIPSGTPAAYASRWHRRFLEEFEYYTEKELLWCPASQNPDSQTEAGKEKRYDNGRIEYGYSTAFSHNYDDPDNVEVWQELQASDLHDPSYTVMLVETRLVKVPPRDPLTSDGLWICYPGYSTSNGIGVAVARHIGNCCVAWADGHISAVEQPDLTYAGSLYYPEALTNTYDDPSYWDRNK
ncbi:MAG: type II secretion system protein [Phycisphaerae bacterium]|nr:type II secretion system protein [Phycisphaerae bacterium]